MKIAFIGQKGIPARSGGVERHVEEIAVRMAALGHEVTVYSRSRYTRTRVPLYKGVRIVYLPSVPTKHLETITHTLMATIHALFSTYEVVNFQSIGPTSLSWILRFFKRSTKIVATFHCKDYEHAKWGLLARTYLRASEFITCRIPHELIVTSRMLQTYVAERYGKQASYIPSGVSVTPDQSTEHIAQWGLQDKKYILAVSRLVRHKGIHFLIDAFKELDDKHLLPADFKLVIVGEDAYTDDYVQQLRRAADGRPNIILAGAQYGATLTQLFSHASCFVQPSLSEGFSLALLEAMGYGLMPLVSAIPGNQEAIADAGAFFAPGSSAAIAEQLAHFLAHPDEAKQLAARALLRVQTYFQWDEMVTKTMAVYTN